jgi:hypothetical protein
LHCVQAVFKELQQQPARSISWMMKAAACMLDAINYLLKLQVLLRWYLVAYQMRLIVMAFATVQLLCFARCCFSESCCCDCSAVASLSSPHCTPLVSAAEPVLALLLSELRGEGACFDSSGPLLLLLLSQRPCWIVRNTTFLQWLAGGSSWRLHALYCLLQQGRHSQCWPFSAIQ